MHQRAGHMKKGLANPPKTLGHGQSLSEKQDVSSGVQEGSVFTLLLQTAPERLEKVWKGRWKDFLVVSGC